MIELTANDCFAKGFHRACYIHPADGGLCIKVSLRGDFRESEREIRYYRHLAGRNISWDMLPRFHGSVETNFGAGAVFDLIRDYDGEISKTLVSYFNSAVLAEANLTGLTQGFKRLRDYLMEHRIVTRTIKAKNVLYHRRDAENGCLMIIDNIGNTEFIPYANYIGYFARAKTARKWRRFEAHTIEHYPSNPFIGAMLPGEPGRGHG